MMAPCGVRVLLVLVCMWTCDNNVVLAAQRGQVVAFFQDSCGAAVPSPCQQVCVDISSGGFYCWCHEGYVIGDDGMTCTAESKIKPVMADHEDNVIHAQNMQFFDGGKLSVHADSAAAMERNNVHIKNEVIVPAKLSVHADTESSSVHIESVDLKKGLPSESSDVHIESVDLKKGLPSLQTESYTRRLKTERGLVLDHYFYNIPERTSSDYSFFHNLDSPEGGDQSLQKEDRLQNFETESSCDKVICENNGTCAFIESATVCQCLLGTYGKHCERVIEVKHPKFDGTGYLALTLQLRAHKQFHVSFQFKPEKDSGLLLAHTGNILGHGSTFWSVVLEDGYVVCRFGCGAGMVELRPSSRVHVADWNRLLITRTGSRWTVQLNMEPGVEGQFQGQCNSLPLQLTVYLGGHYDMSAISAWGTTSRRFVGCIQELQVQGHKFNFRKKSPFVRSMGESIFGVNVGECSEHACDGVLCMNNGTCTVRSADEVVCQCPLGFHGETCQNDFPVHIPYFTGHSYMLYPGLERSVLSYTEIEIVFKPSSPDGTLIYNGYSSDGTGDFISLSLREGFIEFRFDLGTGPAFIRSYETLSMNVWHHVQASRTGLLGVLLVDGQLQKTGQSGGAFTQLTLLDGLYLGGHPSYEHMSRHSNTSSSFTGCIQKVSVNKKILHLMTGAVTGVNIGPCSHPCEGEPCMNGGQCKPHLDTYVCSCPLGYGNSNCEEALEQKPSKLMFRAVSYLLYKDEEIAKRVAGGRMELQMFIRPRGRDGLIFWSGENQNGRSIKDFISLGFHSGSLQLRYNLGSGEALIEYNDSRLFDGRWHLIRVQRDKQDSYMEIDKKEIVEGSSPGAYKSLNTNKLVYLGGMPHVAEKTGGRYTSGFVGCIKGLRLATDYDVKLLAQAHSGRNVDQCRRRIFS